MSSAIAQNTYSPSKAVSDNCIAEARAISEKSTVDYYTLYQNCLKRTADNERRASSAGSNAIDLFKNKCKEYGIKEGSMEMVQCIVYLENNITVGNTQSEQLRQIQNQLSAQENQRIMEQTQKFFAPSNNVIRCTPIQGGPNFGPNAGAMTCR